MPRTQVGSAGPSTRSGAQLEELRYLRDAHDPAVVAETLHAWLAAHWRPDTLAERITRAREMTQRAEQANVIDLVLLGNNWRWTTLMESGQLSAANAVGEVYDRLVATCRDPLHRWVAVYSRATLSIQEGRFAEAEGLVQRSLTLEQAVNNGPPLGFFAIMSTLWLAQGRRDALETMLDSQRALLAAAPLRQFTIASIACELNRPAEARVEFEQLAARQFADVPYNEMWFIFMQRLAQVCAFLNDLPRAERLIELLSAYETRVVISPVTKVYLGPVSQSLALLETSLSRWEDAIGHFEHALEKHREIGARPALARAQYEYARMLLARGEAGDQQRAHTLLEESLATARQLEMPLLIERVEAIQDVDHVSGATRPKLTEPTPDTQVRVPQRRELLDDRVRRHHRPREGQQRRTVSRAPAAPSRAGVPGARLGPGARGRGSDAPLPDPRSPDPVLDARAKAAYKQRLEELREELQEAEGNHDIGRTERARAELEMLAAQLRGAVGLGGRDRAAVTDLERARSAVGKRIRDEIKRIRAANPALGRHLAATITTGYFCSYRPDADLRVAWEL